MSNNTILVVDDEVGIRELLSEILRDEGYRGSRGNRFKRATGASTRPDWCGWNLEPDTTGNLLKVGQAGATMPVVMMSDTAP